MTLNILSIFNKREKRTTLNVGLNRLNIGKMESKSIIAIGVNGYTTKAIQLLFLEFMSAVVQRKI